MNAQAKVQFGQNGNSAHRDEATPAQAPMQHPRRRLADSSVAVMLGCLIITVVFLSAWEWGSVAGHLNKLFFSSPSAIWQSLVGGIQGTLITVDARYTLSAVFIGFITSTIAGIAVAFVLSQFAYLRKITTPFFTALNSLPRVALAPLFVMWFGIGLLSHVMMAASLTFFVVFANTMAGIESVDQDHLLLARLVGASRWQTFKWFVIPSAMPSIFIGLDLGFIFGVLGEVSGEMIAGEHGFGVRLAKDAGVFDTSDYFATLFVLVVISTALSVCFQLVKRRMVRWQSTHVLSGVGK